MKRTVSRSGVRLDKLVADETGCGRRRAAEWIRAGLVRLDGRVAVAGASTRRGQVLEIEPALEPATPPVPKEPRVLLRQGEMLAIDKPAGIHSHAGRRTGSVAEYLEQCIPGQSQVGDRPEEGGVVHRLDRDTSGVLLAATSAQEFRRLRELFGAGQIRKEYLALAAGELGGPVEMDQPLTRRGSRVAAARRHDRALPARTRLLPLETGFGWTLLHVEMSTGVTHQVRAHAALAGYPLLGDAAYGGPALPGAARTGQLLHALRIRLPGGFDVTAAPADDFVAACAILRRGRTDQKS